LLDAINTGTHAAIFGLQRMGKTSLITQGLSEGLERWPELARTILPVSIDLQRLGGDQVKYGDFVRVVIDAITAKISDLGIGRGVANLRALTHELFAENRFDRGDRTQFFLMFAKLLRGFSLAAHRRIVLFVDEFSEVRTMIERNKTLQRQNPMRARTVLPHDMFVDVPFMLHLSSLLKDAELNERFTLVVLVRPFMSEFDETESLQILKLVKPITLYYLDEASAKSLITEPLQDKLAFDAAAVDYLYHLTGGHPYLLQFILKSLVDRTRQTKRLTVNLEDIQSIESRMISEGPAFDAHFEVLVSDYSVDEVAHPKEAELGKGTLAMIARFTNDSHDGWVHQNEILNALAEFSVPVEKAAAILSQLTRTKILLEENINDGLCYRMSVPLLQKRFVRQNLFQKYFKLVVAGQEQSHRRKVRTRPR
jgi:hypothetical protein